MLTDIVLIAFIILYFGLVIGSIGFLIYTWHMDRKTNKKPHLKIIRNEDDE